MSEFTVLLIAKETSEARQIIRSIATVTLRAPVFHTNPEAAIDWIITHECDLCFLDATLLKADPLDLVVRFHQRRPDLPIIILSDDRSARAAVAAFRMGASDYVVKEAGFLNVIMARVQQYAQPGRGATVDPIVASNSSIPEELLRSSYQNRLRVIGRHMDLGGFHSITLLEVSGGFLVRALIVGNRTPQALEFSDRDFPQLVSNAFKQRDEKQRTRAKSELLLYGYEDFLRALGYRFDQQLAEAITVTELERFVVVGGVAMVEGAGQQSLAPFQDFLQSDDIVRMVNEAVRRRSTQGGPTLFRRLIGHA